MSTTHKVLTLALICGSISACRFGNHVEPAPPTVSVNYYETSAQSVTFCATVSENASQSCQPGAIEQVPSLIASVMTDPVALRVDHVKDKAQLVGLSESNPRLPTILNPDNTLEFDGATPWDPLWLDTACATQMRVTERDGKVVKSTNPGEVKIGDTSIPVDGRIELTIDVSRTFEGDCAPSLQAMHDCYIDPTQCGGTSARENLELQSVVQAYFEDFIQAGVMTASDIQTVRSVGYSVSYR